MAIRIATVVFALLAFPSSSAQVTGISGSVLDEHAASLAGVPVYTTQPCCPPRSESSITDENGRFHIEHPGSVLHIEYEGFQPLALVLQGGKADLQIKLRPETEKFRVSNCQTTLRGEQLLGMRDVRFSVPEHGVRLSRVEDVDYVAYGIRVKRKGVALELWFGPTAFNPEPDDKLLISSSEFSQKNTYSPEGKFIGLDSRGRTPEGRLWRHTGGVATGARYSDASPDEAAIFDRIIDSMCLVNEQGTRHH